MIGKLTINVCQQQGQSGQTTTISVEEIQKVVKENVLNFLEKGNFQGTAQDLDDKIELTNTTLQTLSVENIAGLQEALDGKVNVGSGSTGSGTDKHIVRFERDENFSSVIYGDGSSSKIFKIKAIYNDETEQYLPDIEFFDKDLDKLAQEYRQNRFFYSSDMNFNSDFETLIGNMFLNFLENNYGFKEMVKQKLEL